MTQTSDILRKYKWNGTSASLVRFDFINHCSITSPWNYLVKLEHRAEKIYTIDYQICPLVAQNTSIDFSLQYTNYCPLSCPESSGWPSGADLGHPADAQGHRGPYSGLHSRGGDQQCPVGLHPAWLDRHRLQQLPRDPAGLKPTFTSGVDVEDEDNVWIQNLDMFFWVEVNLAGLPQTTTLSWLVDVRMGGGENFVPLHNVLVYSVFDRTNPCVKRSMLSSLFIVLVIISVCTAPKCISGFNNSRWSIHYGVKQCSSNWRLPLECV